MQLSARPLLDNAADQALFAGRDPFLRKIDRSLRTGLNCVVVGDPGSGKTSLVRALMYRADASGDPVHFSYLRAVDARTATDLLGAAVSAVSGRNRGEFDRRSAIELVDELGAAVAAQRESTPGRRVIVVEDVLARAGAEVFGSLRDELWQYVDAQWLVTTSTAQAPGLLRPPADVFFEIRIEIGPLTAAESREILRRRTGPEDAPIPPDVLAAAAAADTPRRLLDLALELSADRAVGGLRLTTLAGLKDRAAALEQVGRPARMLAQVLEVLGWASASDERLLDRMGWTRPRVVQVMAELESRGLVQMREESTGRGRPRKLYRLTPASEFADAASGAASGGAAAWGGMAASGGVAAPDGSVGGST
jgi:Cdc6-like AAA superfamily ATPase